MRTYHIITLGMLLVWATSCSRILYPIKDRLKTVEMVESEGINLELEQSGFYQLRIREMYSFKDSYTYAKNLDIKDAKENNDEYELRYDVLSKKGESDQSDSTQVLIQGDYSNEFEDFTFERIAQDEGSDYPFRKFQQISHIQREEDSLSNIVEETYLYLHDFIPVENDMLEPVSGLAFYFITYPMVEQENRTEYFSNIEAFYSNTIRKINVGIWVRWKNAVVLYLSRQHRSSEFFALVGKVSSGRLSFSGISHPEIMRKGYFDNRLLMRRFLPELVEAERKLLRAEENDQDVLKALLNQTINNSAFVRLDRTFDLSPSSALLFSQMPSDKQFKHRTRERYRKPSVEEDIGAMKLADYKLYFQMSAPSPATYRFRKNQVTFLSE